MSASMIAGNLWFYSLQIALLVLAGSLAPWLLRLRLPAARLLHWQILLAACLLLPLAQPWKNAPLAGVSVTMGPAVISGAGSSSRSIPLTEWMVWIVGAGILARAAWLALGLFRLRLHRRCALLVEPPAAAGRIGATAAFYLCDDVAGPVTFGFRRPVILLPRHFLDLPESLREAICCHELLHVRRRDWLFTVAEEAIRALFWFHPAVWWTLGQIQLAREETVDRETIELTRAREPYLEALLAVAGGGARADLAPAPLFLRKRHLAQRVTTILKEIPMSKTKALLSLAAGVAAMAATSLVAVSFFPLQAPAQELKADTGGARVLHRAPVVYPPEAKRKGIQGQVVVALTLDESGNVLDGRVVSGPDELRRAALQSVLQWHFAPDTTRQAQVAIDFRLGSGPEKEKFAADLVQIPDNAGAIRRIDLESLPAEMRESLSRRLPVREGDAFTRETLERLRKVVAETDEHLVVAYAIRDGVTLRIALPRAGEEAVPQGIPPRIRVGGNMQAAKQVQSTRPVYPPLAKQARIQGLVRLEAVIGKDGKVQNLVLLSGHPLLAPAALEAVRQWVYEITLLNGEPVEVVTVIDVNFTLAE
ncbi:MAG: M56 family metallopeptidase [Acidobacteria bacterium]|nr:M56 family metallopeptidase [Acidobacteriota bacterium]